MIGELMGIADVLFCGTLVPGREISVDVSLRISVIAIVVVSVDDDMKEVVMGSVDVWEVDVTMAIAGLIDDTSSVDDRMGDVVTMLVEVSYSS
jgi:hypothetical protein